MNTKRSVDNETKRDVNNPNESLNIDLYDDNEKNYEKPVESFNDNGFKTQRISPTNDKNKSMSDEEAATKIQSAYRGFKVREDLKKVILIEKKIKTPINFSFLKTGNK